MNRRKSNMEKIMAGNPGRRPLPNEVAVPIVSTEPPNDLPTHLRPYWRRYAPHLIAAGKLTEINQPDFVKMIVLESRLDEIDRALDLGLRKPDANGAKPLFQERRNYHGEVVGIIESLYSRLSRSYHELVRKYKGDFGIRADRMGGIFGPSQPKSKMESLMD